MVYQSTPEQRASNRERVKKWRDENRELYRSYSRAEYAKHPERFLARARKYNYGITQDQYEQMLKDQDWCCAICGCEEWAAPRGILMVDHDHATNKVRGLICDNCNVMLGRAKDNTCRLRIAANYLEGMETWRTSLVGQYPTAEF